MSRRELRPGDRRVSTDDLTGRLGNGASATLLRGPADRVMRDRIADASVDMIYADPPFDTRQVWSGSAGSFDDRWTPNSASADGWKRLRAHSPAGAALLASIGATPGRTAYLGVMAAIIIECRRALKPTGTLWLHFDATAGAHLRILCEVVFGIEQALGTLVWRRSSGSSSSCKRGFGVSHDTIACFGRTRASAWRLWRLGAIGGDPLSGDWRPRFDDIAAAKPLTATARERIGYPTQKPVALLEELISAATLPGALILDPTMGSGTTCIAALRAGRRAIGIDASSDAIAAARKRVNAERTR